MLQELCLLLAIVTAKVRATGKRFKPFEDFVEDELQKWLNFHRFVAFAPSIFETCFFGDRNTSNAKDRMWLLEFGRCESLWGKIMAMIFLFTIHQFLFVYWLEVWYTSVLFWKILVKTAYNTYNGWDSNGFYKVSQLVMPHFSIYLWGGYTFYRCTIFSYLSSHECSPQVWIEIPTYMRLCAFVSFLLFLAIQARSDSYTHLYVFFCAFRPKSKSHATVLAFIFVIDYYSDLTPNDWSRYASQPSRSL